MIVIVVEYALILSFVTFYLGWKIGKREGKQEGLTEMGEIVMRNFPFPGETK